MALYIIGDTYGDFRKFLPERFPEQERLTKEDLVMICGNFGGVWYGDHRDDEELDFLEAVRQRCRFRYWFFGHYHDNGIVRERFVLLYEKMIILKQ